SWILRTFWVGYRRDLEVTDLYTPLKERANVEDVDVEDMNGVNTDKLFEALEVEFEDKVDQNYSKQNLEVEFEDKVDQKSSNDTECFIRLDDGNMDHAEKLVQPSEMEALDIRTNHCIICCYYTTGDALVICTHCMAYPSNYGKISLRNISDEGMYLVRTHQEWSYCTQGAECSICEEPMYTVFPQHVSTLYTLKKLLSAPCKSECFAWLQRCDECIERLEELCRAKRPRLTVGHRQSVVARIHYTAVLNLSGIAFPMTLKDIPKFERLNAVSINHTTTNDISYLTRRRRYYGDIGGYLCNICIICSICCYYVLLLFFFTYYCSFM
ncbi:hypothetical protein ALC57_04464, partial [Trachymyrmex cornetzi]